MTNGKASEYDLSTNLRANFNPRAKFTAAVHVSEAQPLPNVNARARVLVLVLVQVLTRS